MPRDHEKRDLILYGVNNGFNLVTKPVPETLRSEVNNYRSATNPVDRPKIEKQIIEEVQNGRYVIVDSKPDIVSAIGAIPKDEMRERMRPIHDASRPYGGALNDFAETDPFKYQSVQDVINLIKPGDYLGKLDLQAAYRSVGISRSNYKYTGLKWRFSGDKADTYMIDTRLCFGSKRAPAIFNDLSNAVLAIMRKKGYYNIVCYLDDYICVCTTYEECQRTMLALMKVLRELGFSINYNKVIGPSQIITFLGIEINTITMTTKLPQEKVIDLDFRKCIRVIRSQNEDYSPLLVN